MLPAGIRDPRTREATAGHGSSALWLVQAWRRSSFDYWCTEVVKLAELVLDEAPITTAAATAAQDRTGQDRTR